MTREPDIGSQDTLPRGLAAKSIVEAPALTDGRRVFVNRLWPGGLSKDEARLAEWRPDWAPSWPLREWFGFLPERWREFCDRYERELEVRGKLHDLRALARRARTEQVTLLFSDPDRVRNVATALLVVISRLERDRR